MRQPELQVVEVRTGDLVPYANNAKLHSQLQVGQIASSIEEFGFNDPIAVWETPDGRMEVVEGHGRVLAAQRLGLDKVPVFYLNHLSDEQRRAYTHVHNQTTLSSGFDPDRLDVDIRQLDFDWASFGLGSEPFSALRDLMDEDFAAGPTTGDNDEFSMTFTFAASDREALERFVRGVGKGAVSAMILREASKWEG